MKNGFSLIELMVSSLIGVFIIGLFFNFFLDNLRYITYHENRSAIQSAAQHALFFMKNDLRRAASGVSNHSKLIEYSKKEYATLSSTQDLKTLSNASNATCEYECNGIDLCTGFTRGYTSACTLKRGITSPALSSSDTELHIKPQNLFVAVGNCGSAPCTGEGIGVDGSDVIAVLLNPADDKDCANNTVDATSLTANRYFIKKPSESSDASLFCQGFNPETGVAWGDAEEIVRGVSNLQVLYAYSDDGENVTRYRHAGSINNWWQVHGIQLGIIAHGGLVASNSVLPQKPIIMMGKKYDNDFHGRSIYGFTIMQRLKYNRKNQFWRDKTFN